MKQISERVQLLNDKPENSGGRYVLYWMQMYKRATHNHALNFAIELANERRLPLVVYEGLKYYYPWANDRLHTFILEGVEEKYEEFARLGIRYVFYLQKDESSPKNTVAQIAREAALIVTDDFPCFIIPRHNLHISEKADIPVYAVDSNGMIPMSKFEKEEYAAYTIRPKIKRMLPDYSALFRDAKIEIERPQLKVDCPETKVTAENITELVAECDIDHTVKPSPFFHGGSRNAHKRLKLFLDEILFAYDELRNEASIDGTSRMSMYLHFGFISVQEIVAAVDKQNKIRAEAKSVFLEELIVRRELSYNMTRFNPNYDSIAALPPWVQQSMREHIDDEREHIYTLEQLEAGRTADEVWNAAQRELVETGAMHNYVRMLWGKNVINWTKNYEEAFAVLEHLNNKYALDGRNPNSYAGILWCFGKHDRPWFERPVFGKIRYMNSNGTRRKIDAPKYIAWTKTLTNTQQDLFPEEA
jgi:deoxyribodipyrimidine photo-lyase